MLYILFIFLCGTSLAQENTLELPQPDSKIPAINKERIAPPSQKIEKLVVTGSYIKRIQTEGPSPLVTLDSELFEKTGSQTLSDLLLESPLFSSSREFSGFYSFHGQGAQSTLLLLNGLRIPKLGTPGRSSFNSVRSISAGIIDRVEILKDGSSALYGSDAAAGVMNVITKKDYDGAEFSYRLSVPEIGVGRSSTYNAAYGENYSRGQWLTSIQYLDAQGYWHDDLGSYSQSRRHNGLASSGYVSAKDEKGRFTPLRWLGPNRVNQKGKTKRLKVNRLPFDQVKANRNNLSVFLAGGLELSSQMDLSVMAIYNRHVRQTNDPPHNLVYDGTLLAPLDLNKIQSPDIRELVAKEKLSDPTAYLPGYSPLEEVGLLESRLKENSYNLQMSLQKEYLQTWNWQLASSLGILSEEETISRGIVDLEAARTLLYKGIWDPSLPAGDPMKQNSLASAMASPSYLYNSQMISSKFVTSGEIFDFGRLWGMGGAVSLALGLETQNESFEDKNDEILATGQLSVPRVVNLRGNRNIQSAFLELTTNPLDMLEFQAAGRFDQYSDVGGTFNSKFALGFRPSKTVLLRSSWGSSFRAPGIRSMALQPFNNWESFPDWIQCSTGASCENDILYNVQRFRDPNLSPETSEHYNFGMLYQPNKFWTFGFDQWNFLGKNTLTQLYGADVTRFEALSGNDNLRSFGIDIQRDGNSTLQTVIMPDRINMGSRTIKGVDSNMSFRHPIRLFGNSLKFVSNINHSQIFEKKSEKFLGAIIDKQEGQNWRNIISMGLRGQRHGYRLASRTASGGRVPNNPGATFSIHTEYDFNYTYGFNWGGRFNFGVKNILNTRPPFDFTKSTVTFHKPLRKSFSPLRRIFYTGYSQTF